MVVPVFIPLLLFSGGLLLGWTCPARRDVFLCTLLLSVFGSLLAFLLLRRPWSKYVPLLIPLLFLGAVRTSLRLNPYLPEHHLVRYISDEAAFLEGVIYRQPKVFPSCTLLPLESRCVRKGGESHPVTGKVDLFLNEEVHGFQVGESLLVKARMSRLRDRGNPGEMEKKPRAFLRRVYVKGYVQDRNHILRLGNTGGYRFQQWVQRIRERIENFLREEADPETSGLLKAWLLGDRSQLPDEVDRSFRESGLAHLLALSGLHVGMICFLFYIGWKFLLQRSSRLLMQIPVQKVALLASLPPVLFYVVLAGSPVTAVRAVVMAMLFAGSFYLGRAHSLWNGLSVAALFILMSNPGSLFSPSFLFSFVTVGFLLAGLPHRFSPDPTGASRTGIGVRPLVSRSVYGARQILSVSALACLAVAPLTAYFFNAVTPLAPLANLVVVPLVCWFVLPLGLTAGFLSLISTPLARAVLWLDGHGAQLVIEAARLFSRIPGSCIRTGRPTLLEIGIFYTALILVLVPWKSIWKKRLVILCLSVFCLSVVWAMVQPKLSRDLKITFLSVGNGDSALLEFPGGKRMLLDGGPARKGFFDAGERIVSPFLGARRFCRLDYLVVSHGQSDHYGGLQHIAEHFRPREVWIPVETGNEEAGYWNFLNRCKRLGLHQKRLCRAWGNPSFHGVGLEVLHPPCADGMGESKAEFSGSGNVNNASLVLRITYGSVCFLFTGDIEKDVETDLLSQGPALRAFLLKAPHHGSKSSSSALFLDQVDATIAIISSGYRNRYGFPAEPVLERYRERGVSLDRTSHDGAIQLRTDGKTVVITTHSGREQIFSCPVRPAEKTVDFPQFSRLTAEVTPPDPAP